jgi:hypothetical protein
LNGYNVYQSSQLPKDLTKGTLSSTAHAMIFGNFQDLLIGYYSGLDVLKKNKQLRLQITT